MVHIWPTLDSNLDGMDSEHKKDNFNGGAILAGLICFIFIMVFNALHHKIQLRPYELEAHSFDFLNKKNLWAANIALASLGTLLSDLSRWKWMALLGLVIGVLLQFAYQFYFNLRPNLLFAELLIPLVFVLLGANSFYNWMLVKGY